jgi:hypothetical protein
VWIIILLGEETVAIGLAERQDEFQNGLRLISAEYIPCARGAVVTLIGISRETAARSRTVRSSGHVGEHRIEKISGSIE